MALRHLDSFDHYTTISQKYTTTSGAVTIDGVGARTGPRGARASSGYWSLTLDAQGTWIIGIALRTAGGSGGQIINTRDGPIQGALAVNDDRTLSLRRGGVTVATSTQSLVNGVFYYIEFKHIIDNVAGLLEVRVDEAVWATFTGDTQATANPTANGIMMGAIDNIVWAWHFDDYYILDGTGAAPNNDYWGNTQIEALVPNGAGAYTEWTTLVGAATHWEAEDEVPPDEDTSYVESATLDQRDTYAFGNLSVVSATINGIQVLMRGRTTAAGADNLARLYRRAGVDNQGADVALSTSYAYIREIMATDPIAAAAWTIDNLNAAEFGSRVR